MIGYVLERSWNKVNPGGKTKEAFERNETPLGLQSPAELVASFETSRRKVLAKEQVEKMPLTNEDIEFVGLVQMFIAEERKELGLPPGYYIPLERVRLFHPEVWELQGKTVRGQYDFRKDTPQAVLSGGYEHFSPLSHELRHQASYFESDPAGGDFFVRLGCRNLKEGTGNGVDEALTEEGNRRMFERHLDVLTTRFGLNKPHSKEEILAEFGSKEGVYDIYRNVVKAVAVQVDNTLYGGKDTTWDNLRRLQLGGDPNVYTEIESVIGRDAFRVLMAMGNRHFFDLNALMRDSTLPSEDSALNVIEVWIERYFANTHKLAEPERQKVIEQILPYLKEKPDQTDQVIVDTGSK